jgi:signal transduction histidine kinase
VNQAIPPRTQERSLAPQRESEPRVWRLLVALAIASIGVLLSLVAWSALGSSEREALDARLASIAAEISRSLESAFGQEVEQMRDLARTWGTLGTEDAARWQAEANRFRQMHASCLALEWSPSSLRRETTLASGTPESLGFLDGSALDANVEETRLAAAAGGYETVLGPRPGPEGRNLFEYLIPVPTGDHETKVLAALVDPGATVRRVVGPWLEDYGIAVSIGSVEVFRHIESPGRGVARSVERRAFRAGLQGQDGTIAVEPGAGLLASPRQPLRDVVLVGSIVLSVLVAMTYWVGQLAFLRARELHEATFELEEQRDALDRVRRERQTLTAGMISMKVEMESRSSRERAEPATSELETFTYSVSHDLRSPMGAILNYAGVLSEDYHDALGPEGRDHLHRIAASAQKAIAMMDGLLAFSRVGSRELKITAIDVGTMVREIHAELAGARHDSEPVPELSMGVLPPAKADRTLLCTLFTNLLSNSFKFTQGVEHPTVEVGGYAREDGVVYYVKDNGAGFDMRYANKLFRVFEQLPTKEPHDGHGIGLAVVERIVRRHGGSIRAEAVPGKGATFFVTLPDGTPHGDGQEPS